MTSDVTLEVAGLTKRFGPRTAVRDLSFTAHRGDIVGLLGSNGAGKTTAIRLLTTVLTPSSGRFSVAGVPSSRPLELRRRVGALPESAGFAGARSGREYLRYHARLFGLASREAEERAGELLSEVGLSDRASSPVSAYSRGMRQRLGIARALVNRPDVVFLDEPTLGLDPAGQRQMLRIVRDIAEQRGTTVVLSTHALPEVEEVCSSVLIVGQGRVLASGTVEEVTRTAAAAPKAQLTVAPHDVARARAVLTALPGLRLAPPGERPENLDFALTKGGGMNHVLAAVLAADLPVRSFRIARATLSDAFLAMTGDAR